MKLVTNQAIFSALPKSQDKKLRILRKRRAFIDANKTTFLENESPTLRVFIKSIRLSKTKQQPDHKKRVNKEIPSSINSILIF